MKGERQILIVDDDVDFANFIYDVAKTMNLECTVISNSLDFMNAYNPSVKLVFLDLNIPNIDGIELLRLIEKKQLKTDIVLMSGVDKRVIESAEEFAVSKGLSVVGRFQKPIRLNELENLLKKLTGPKKFKISEKEETTSGKFLVTMTELNRAIRNNNFVVYYQPKIEITTGKLLGVEALIRWLHPEHGLILPDKFIFLAESSGLIDTISWIVIKKSIAEIESVKKKVSFNITLSLNLSTSSLHDLEFPDKLLAIIKQSTINPEDIIFEVTESGLIKELSTALDIFTRLRLKNIKLSIDDFGTGYAMMQQLKLIPATEIKIDKSFVQTMLSVDSARVTVKKVIEMGHELGMKVVAEGVETKEQLQYLKDLQCDIAQGYYYCKPLPIIDLVDWVNSQNVKRQP